MSDSLTYSLKNIPRIQEAVLSMKEVLLTNLMMINEEPSPTFKELKRTKILLDRFLTAGLEKVSTDEKNNAIGTIPGESGDRSILAVAHLDTHYPETIDHSVSVDTDILSGPGVGDNSLGLAALATLPDILEQLGHSFSSDIVLLGSSRSLGRGDLEGLRFFLDKTDIKIDTGICVEGVAFGRLSHSSYGMLRGELVFNSHEGNEASYFDAAGAIYHMNDMINSILRIPLPYKPRTSIVLGSLNAGTTYNTLASRATLRFEIRSEEREMVMDIAGKIEDMAQEMASQTQAEISFNRVAYRMPGGISFSHPLVADTRKILKELGTTPQVSPSTSELSAFIDKNIPAVTIGLTNSAYIDEDTERIYIDPIIKGLTQLIALLIAADKEGKS